MAGVLYGVGVGPGDPDLITLKTYNLFQKADVIVTPTGKMGKPSVAYRIAKPHLPENSRLLEMDFPMLSLSEERDVLEKKWEENASVIHDLIEEGKTVVFLTLGDPMVFSTYSYIMEYLLEHDIQIETVSGITSFCNLAAQINIPLTQGEESLGIVSMTQPKEEIRAILEAHQNIVVMKISADNTWMAEELITRGLETSFVLVSNIGMANQKVTRDIRDLKGKIPYLSTLLIKKNYPLG